MPINRRSFLLTVPAAAWASCSGGAPRLVVVIDDVSPSYHRGETVAAEQRAIVAALGPGDRFTDVELGGPFSPDRVKVQCVMPAALPEWLARARRPRDLISNQQHLTALWRKVDAQRAPVAAFMASRRHIQGPTPVFETLAYVADHMARSGAVEKRLAIFSDLVHDYAGRTSENPPAGMPLRFDGVNVFALFVPWTRDFHRREGAWRNWFLSCGACAFAMLDTAQSRVASILPPSPVPRVLRRRF